MHIKEGFKIQKISGQNTIVADKGQNEWFNSTIVLTDTATFLWNMLKDKDVTKREMLNALLDNFEMSTVLALGDLDVFVRTLKDNGIIEDENEKRGK